MISAEKIPNNVNLSDNKRLLRALEHWQPKYLQWWRDMGPQGFQDYHQVYVRTATSVDPEGWAHFEFVKLPEYRWGIFLAEPTADRRIGFGDFFGRPVWQEVPGEFRNQLRRLIVTQGDTEPASVEQQRWLGQRCPKPLRPPQPVPGQRRGGTPSLGDGLSAPLVFRPGRPRRGRGAARTPEREPRPAADSRGVQRADRQLARLLHVHDVHGPRRQIAAHVVVRELAGSAVAHDPLHVDRGSASHVRRRDRCRAHSGTHVSAHARSRLFRGCTAGGRHRPPDDSAAFESLVQSQPRPSWRGGLEQCGGLFRERPQGSRQGRHLRGPPREGRRLQHGRSSRTAGRSPGKS